MRITNTFDKILLIVFFLFSCWFMGKSFSYDGWTHEFIIARNVVGDFGLHLSLIRSVSWGRNIPVESPFYPGVPMPYHYAVDVFTGLLERAGVRIDIAYNGISAVAFTGLLYLIYLLAQRIFGKNRFIGVISVLLFVFHSGLTFVDFFRGKSISFSLLNDIWRIPNYIHAGPFDGSLISTFFTLNVYANQRHTVVALAVGLWIVYTLIPVLFDKKDVKYYTLLPYGCMLGLLGWVHTLLFLGFSFVLGTLCLLYKKYRYILQLFLPAAFIFLPHAATIVQVTQASHHLLFNPGFLSPRPFAWPSFMYYWWLNLGIAVIFIPLGFILADKKQKIFFVPFILLCIIANTFQLSFRIDHNHALINLFVIIGNMYIAYALFYVWQKRIHAKFSVAVCFFLLTISGFLDLMVIKNDYHLRIADAPKNPLMQWIKVHTDPNAIFIAPPQLLDPVTLSGRRNFIGNDYYLSVMGYDDQDRLQIVKRIYEKHDENAINLAKKQGVQYIIYDDTEKSFRVDKL